MGDDKRGYAESNGDVVLTMSHADFELLLMMLGGATALAHAGRGATTLREAVAFVNRLNHGNPNFVPYKVEE